MRNPCRILTLSSSEEFIFPPAGQHQAPTWKTKLPDPDCPGAELELAAGSAEIVEFCAKAVEDCGGAAKMPWWDLLCGIWRPGFLHWRREGCLPDPPVVDTFASVLVGGLKIARLSTVCVETGVNRLKRVGRAVVGGSMSQITTQRRMRVYDKKVELRATGHRQAKALQLQLSRRTGTGDAGGEAEGCPSDDGNGEEDDHMLPAGLATYDTSTVKGDSKLDLMCILHAVRQHADKHPGSYKHALKFAKDKAANARRSEHAHNLVTSGVLAELQRHRVANQKGGTSYLKRKADAAAAAAKGHISPESFGLVSLAGNAYTRAKLQLLLAVREQREGITLSAANAAIRAAATKPELAQAAVSAFFGTEWESTHVPTHDPTASVEDDKATQCRAVAYAKKHGLAKQKAKKPRRRRGRAR